MTGWKNALKGYTQRKIWLFLFLGFSCGLPYNLLGYSLSLWLKDIGFALSVVGFFSLVFIPYSLKFLWAPIVDRIRVPYLADRFGAKKTWGFLFQIGLVLSIFSLALFPPHADTWVVTFVLALCVAFFATSQDIVVDALRIDTLKTEELGEGAGAYQFGYRMGLLLSGAGVVALSTLISWSMAYLLVGYFVLTGFVALFFIQEEREQPVATNQHWFTVFVRHPFVDFMRHQGWFLILIFIVLYKMSNAVLGRMALPFYMDVGFSKEQIALVSGAIGPWITMAGIPVGGILVMRFGILKSLFGLGMVEVMTSLAFMVLSMVGPLMPLFLGVIGFDNIVGGMGGAVFVAYLSSLCSKQYSATQYALLTSLMAISASVIAGFSGILAQCLGWPLFFLLTGVLMVPALVLLFYLTEETHESQENI